MARDSLYFMSQVSSQSESVLTPMGVCVDTVGVGALEGA